VTILNVSIHASAREATVFPSRYGRQDGVSFHASAREATARFGYFLLITPYM